MRSSKPPSARCLEIPNFEYHFVIGITADESDVTKRTNGFIKKGWRLGNPITIGSSENRNTVAHPTGNVYLMNSMYMPAGLSFTNWMDIAAACRARAPRFLQEDTYIWMLDEEKF